VFVVVGVGNVTFTVAGFIIIVVDVALFLLCLMFLVLEFLVLLLTFYCV
jgi:hypothetical protein